MSDGMDVIRTFQSDYMAGGAEQACAPLTAARKHVARTMPFAPNIDPAVAANVDLLG